MHQNEASSKSRSRSIKIAFGVISLVTLVLGVAINWFASATGLATEVTNAAAFGMLLTAVAHAIALSMWDRKN